MSGRGYPAAVPAPPVGERRAADLRRALEQPWYHTIELAPGAVTSGAVDLRSVAPRLLPGDLHGRRALDVGTFDGFWAFELHRRGAEVVATDLDSFDAAEWPPQNRERLAREAGDRVPGERFHLAASLVGADVTRIECSIYDLDAGALGGPFDYAVVGDLLLHLRDPVGGLERLRSVLAPGGRLLLVEQVDPALSVLRPRSPSASFQAHRTDYNWWEANLAGLKAWLRTAGFASVRRRAIFRLDAVGAQRRWHAALEAESP